MHRADLLIKIKKKTYEFLAFLALESRVVRLCERLRVLRSIYAQPSLLYLLNYISSQKEN